MKKILLISNRVMHYRVSIYNYFYRRFKECGYDFIVRSNELQKQNTHPLEFDFKEIEFKFNRYRKEIKNIGPDFVIFFLHLKEIIYWELVHWLKFKGIPVIYWNKAINYDDPDNKMRCRLFRYMHNVSDGIILYSGEEIKHIKDKNKHKVYIANNTINFEDFPEISESKEQIKEELGIPFKKIVLFVGRMGSGGGRKKVHHLINIFKEIDAHEIGLLLVGSGMDQSLLDGINKSNTIYLGEIHDPHHIQISKTFKMADVFSVPGHIGLGLNQALFWGLPAVTEAGDQPPEIQYLINGRNGFIVPNNDQDELRKKILYLLHNDSIRHEFSNNAKKDIMQYATVENMFVGFKNCVEYLAEKGR